MKEIYLILGLIIAFCGLMFVVFRKLDSAQNSNLRMVTQGTYTKYWQIIQNHRVTKYPQELANLFINFGHISYISDLLKPISTNFRYLFSYIFFFGFTFLNFAFWGYLLSFLFPNLSSSLPYYFMLYLFIAQKIIRTDNIKILAIEVNLDGKDESVQEEMLKAQQMRIGSKAIVETINLGLILSFIVFTLGKIFDYYFLDSISFFQMQSVVFINILFDSLTVLFTVISLKRIALSGLWTSFLLVVVNVGIAFLFSIILTFVLKNFYDFPSMSNFSIVEIVLGWTSEKNEFVGGWFFLAHSSFLPILFYLFIVLISLLIRASVLPIGREFKKSSVADKPHYHTANLFAVIGSFSAFLIAVLKLVEYYRYG